MPHALRRLRFAALLVFAAVLLNAPANAQTIYEAPADDGDRLTVEWARPIFPQNGFTFITSSLFLSGRFSVADNVRIIGEIPIGLAQYGDSFPDDDQTLTGDIGNPFIGVEYSNPSYVLEAGVRLPVLSFEDFNTSGNAPAALISRFANQNRPIAFEPEILAFSVLNSFRRESNNLPLEFRLRGGPVVAVPTSSDQFPNRETEVYTEFNTSLWLTQDVIEVGAGLTNLLLLTEDLDLPERSYTDVGLSVFGRFDSVEPGLSLRFPLDGRTSTVSPYTVSLMLRIPLD